MKLGMIAIILPFFAACSTANTVGYQSPKWSQMPPLTKEQNAYEVQQIRANEQYKERLRQQGYTVCERKSQYTACK